MKAQSPQFVNAQVYPVHTIKVRTYRVLVLCMLQTVIAVYTYAQEPAFRHYTVDDGLASNTVYGMLHDTRGYLWMCTEAGVSRFDGQKFTNFTLSDGLSDNEMLRVNEDSKGRIWFLGFNGTLTYYYNGKFFNPENDTVLKKAKSKFSFLCFFEDKQHRLWFTTDYNYIMIDGKNVKRNDSLWKEGIAMRGIVMNGRDGGVYILTSEYSGFDVLHLITGGKCIGYKPRYTKTDGCDICRLQDVGVLFCAKEGIVWQRDTTQQLIVATGKEFEPELMRAVFVSNNNKLWITTNGKGVFCYDYRNLGKPPERYLSKKNTCVMCEDQEGNIWVSTLDDGVYMLPQGFSAIKNYNAGNRVFSVAKDDGGNLYAGLGYGKAEVINKGIITPLPCPETKNRYNRILKIIAHGKHLWLASDEYLLHINLAKKTNCKLVCFESGIKKFWPLGSIKDICLYKDRLSACDPHHVFYENTSFFRECCSPAEVITQDIRRDYSVYIDYNGITWYGAQGGLYSYNGKENSNHHPLNGIDQEVRISSIAETADSVLILATYGYGVFFYKDDKILGRITEQNGLGSNICKRVFVDKNDIYIATARGVDVIKYNKSNIVVSRKYTVADGLLSDDVNDVFADDSDICIATSEGLSVIGRKTVADIPSVPPLLYISSIENSGRLLSPDSAYSFPYYQNSLHFDFFAISYLHPKEIKYQYRLDDAKPWVETENTSIDYASLPKGRYRFQIRAKISDGAWGGVKSFNFIIHPPFWNTNGFVAGCAICFILLVALVAVYIVKAAKRKHREELKIKDQVAYLEQQALQAMMNPHFIFNVMNSIQHYINNNETHEANVYLSNFASLIRMNLDISSKRYIPLDDEIAYLKLFLSLEGLRFGQRLTYNIDIDPAIDGDETMIPVMLLQPYIENAIWHGILPKKESGHVEVDIKKEKDGMLHIRITDNGVGMPERKDANGGEIKTRISKGMKMTQQRLDLIGELTGHKLYFHIRDAYPGEKYRGTSIEFLLPGDLC